MVGDTTKVPYGLWSKEPDITDGLGTINPYGCDEGPDGGCTGGYNGGGTGTGIGEAGETGAGAGT